jgi:uncharacterized membrane protein
VRVVLADGTVIADEANVQHNRNYSSMQANMQKMAATASRAIKAGMGGAGAAPAAAAAPKQATATKAGGGAAPSGIGLATKVATDKVVAATAD